MNRCPNCGATTLAETVAGQCPRCLLRVASSDDEIVGDAGFDPARRQFGDYLLKRQVGAGGMGVVYEANRLADGRTVALKLIRDAHVASPVQLRRFTLESEAVARLDHPNIVRIHEIGDGDGTPFFSMDFIDGESLGARLTQGALVGNPDARSTSEPAAEARIARLMAKLARAVHHAHARGVLHRDLKPGNILIDTEGEPHLTDFGLAKMLEPNVKGTDQRTLTASGDLPGTPGYMSPEQVLGTNVGPAADIYGLGAVLYALLTGRPPFAGATPLELFKQIAEQAPTRPRSWNPSVSPDLETICLKCLEKDPRHRYGAAQLLAEDLDNFAAGRAIQARRLSPPRRAQQWIKRNPLGAALIASLCLGLSAALVLLKTVNDQRRAVELDRDEAFDEGMQQISQIWRDPPTKSVTISARDLAILAGRSPAGLARARHQLTLGISANDGPSSMAQRYARLLGGLQLGMERELGESVAFQVRLFKRFNRNDETLARGEVDFIVLSAVEFLRAQQVAPRSVALAWANTSREGMIFARPNSSVQRLAELRGKSVAFPDPDLSLNVWAKARLLAAGLHADDLLFCTNFVDQGNETGHPIISVAETLSRVLRGELDAGVTHRSDFERYRHLGLVILDQFSETPNLLAARNGLDPKLAEALRKAIHAPATASWPDARFLVDAPDAPGPSTGSLLELLRQAMQAAEQFDRATKK